MPRTKPTALEEARHFFSNELKDVMKRRRVWAEKDAFEYLVNLMLQYMESETFFAKNAEGKFENQVLAQLYADYLDGDEQTQIIKLRRLGDVCLFITGFFPESIKRKVVDLDYYFGMGGTAYSMLSAIHLSKMTKEVFAELSHKFKDFSSVLAELSDKSGIQTNADVLALYERWLLTGDDRLRDLLQEQGIDVPLQVEMKTKH